jgi:hypothetical protein
VNLESWHAPRSKIRHARASSTGDSKILRKDREGLQDVLVRVPLWETNQTPPKPRLDGHYQELGSIAPRKRPPSLKGIELTPVAVSRKQPIERDPARTPVFAKDADPLSEDAFDGEPKPTASVKGEENLTRSNCARVHPTTRTLRSRLGSVHHTTDTAGGPTSPSPGLAWATQQERLKLARTHNPDTLDQFGT